jgi:copper homeostasis protein
MLEVVVTSVEDAVAAAAGGATSVEVVREFALGGLTPPLDLVRAIRHAVEIEVNVIVRPHANGFSYSRDEARAMMGDAAQFDELGLSHLVVMGLTAAGSLDLPLLRMIRDAAPNTGISLHRAIDVAAQPEQTIKEAVGYATRLLTSGPQFGAQSGTHGDVWTNRAILRQWVLNYGEFFQIAVGGGISATQLTELVSEIGADVYHVGSAARREGRVDQALVAALSEIVDWTM